MGWIIEGLTDLGTIFTAFFITVWKVAITIGIFLIPIMFFLAITYYCYAAAMPKKGKWKPLNYVIFGLSLAIFITLGGHVLGFVADAIIKAVK